MSQFLSAEELRNSRLLNKTLPDRGGAKYLSLRDEALNDSELQYLLNERKQALEEARIEKLGGLSRGEWIPERRIVKVTKQVGKYMQHMGSSIDGNRVLYPEEALFLIDVKCMEVYYGGLPLSMMEAYERFFKKDKNAQRNYQVYSHLSRLGYIVVKHEGRSTFTEYERRIGLDLHLKRQKHGSDSVAKLEDFRSSGDATAGLVHEIDDSNKNNLQQASNANKRQKMQHSSSLPSKPDAGSQQSCILLRYPDISIPNAFGKRLFGVLSASDCLLPKNVKLKKEMHIVDLAKIYSQENSKAEVWSPERHSSRFHHNRRDERDEGSMSQRFYSTKSTYTKESRIRSRINTKAGSWNEYKKELTVKSDELIAARESTSTGVRPLLQPENATSVGSILKGLQVLEQVRLSTSPDFRRASDLPPLVVTYDVHLPAAEYSKRQDPLPNSRLVITSSLEPLPELSQILSTLSHFGDKIPLHFAVVDGQDVAFYSFNDVSIPVLDGK